MYESEQVRCVNAEKHTEVTKLENGKKVFTDFSGSCVITKQFYW